MDKRDTGKTSNNLESIIKIWVGLCSLFSLIIFIYGQFYIRNQSLYNSTCNVYDAVWTYTDPDGVTSTYRTNDSINVKGIDTIHLELTLPDEIQEGTCLFFKTSRDLDAYIDGELRNSYSISYSALGRTVKSQWVSVTLRCADAGKKLVIERENYNADQYLLREIYLGNRLGFATNLIHENILILFLSFAIITFGIVIVAICLVYRIRGRRPFPLWYLSLGVLGGAFWLILDNLTYPVFFRNYFVDGITAFLVIMIVPFPFAAYIDCITGHRYRKATDVIYVMIVANFTVMSILHFCGIADFSTTMPIGNITIAIVAVFLFVVIIYDTYVLKHKENSIIALGYSAFTLLGIIEIIHLNLTLHTNDGIFVAIGLMLLLVNAVYYELKRISEMRAVTIEAQKANNAKTTFLANMSHEIRTPINAILGMDELILREDTNPKITEYARNIKDAGNALLEIISDVLDFSKIEQGKMEIINAEYDTRQLINNIITMISVKTDEKGLRFERNISDDLPSKLIGDEKSLREILINLLGNAVKYTQKGSICFTVKEEKTDEKRIDLCISVKDTGIGIKDEDKSRLFMQFERFDHAKNRSIEGTGLGLAISANLIKLMGGTIDCISTYGKGSDFIVRIPQDVADSTPIGDIEKNNTVTDAGSDEDILDDLNGVKVLVVDDSIMNLKVAGGLLKILHADVVTCKSGLEMLDLIQKEKYDIILLDHMMPEPDGIETLKRAKELAGNLNNDTPYIALTANAIAGAKEMYIENGFSDYLSKPMKIEELSCVIKVNLKKNVDNGVS